ncbi:hypothetical protein [uncultured Clostridium sp.]|uniref:hypothetical protein n=1 Tax=uncultured Clostridium sp. TaxID=59620 RepID=UPI0026710D74|nr:hypothetical protein [uncultured Clostridium sp.]
MAVCKAQDAEDVRSIANNISEPYAIREYKKDLILRKCLEILKAIEIIIDKAIDKVNIVEIDVAIYLFIFIFKFNKKQTVLKINSIIIENKNYYGIY